MEKVTRKTIVFLVMSALLLSMFSLLGCGSIPRDIGSAEELAAMETNKSYRLTSDIDLGGRIWTPKSVRAFDGQGHTISNCIINVGAGNDSEDIGFFTSAGNVNGVTFENITLALADPIQHNNLSSYAGVGIVVGRGTVSNVTLRNCTISGTINATYVWLGFVGRNLNGDFSNCTVENCDMRLSLSARVVEIGGISPNNSCSGCTVKGCTFDLSANNELNIGGIIGELESGRHADSNISENNTFIIKSTASTNSATRVGGVLGYIENQNGTMEKCLSMGNSFDVSVASNYTVGGVVGRNDGEVSDCLSDNNTINATSGSVHTAYAGGLCGSNNGNVSMCVAQNCGITGISSTGDNVSVAGAVAATATSIARCAVKDCFASGGNADAFAAKADNLIYLCYLYGSVQSKNANAISLLSEDEWQNIISLLSLDESIWSMGYGNNLVLNI